MPNTEYWGRSYENQNPHPEADWHESGSEHHPHLNGLWRAWANGATVDTVHGDYDYLRDFNFDHFLNNMHRYGGLDAEGYDQNYHVNNAYEAARSRRDIRTRDMGEKISAKSRALVHEPGVLADQLEEEGHGNLAKGMRHAELVHTYHGKDEANFHDVAFMHSGRAHILLRNHAGDRRYHYTIDPKTYRGTK